MKQQISDLQYSYNEILVLNEKNAREIKAKEELISQIQESHNGTVHRLRNDIIDLEQSMMQKIELSYAAYEDLRTRTVFLHQERVRFEGIQETLENSLKREVVQGMRYVATIAHKDKELNELKTLCELRVEQLSTCESTIEL